MLSERHPLCLTGPSAALLKRSNVDSMDVGSYCDKLRLAIMEPHNGLQRTCAGTHNDGKLPFRLATQLYYDTLRIYKLQVDSLLKRSKMLVAHSNFYLQPLLDTKRKLSAATSVPRKKLRVTGSTKDFSISSYNELLEECENLQHWSQWEMAIDDQSIKTMKSNSQVIQIREITIREVITDMKQPEPFDDNGFGSATTEELNEFLQFFSDLPSSEKRQIAKHKSPAASSVAEKMESEDLCIELPRLEEFNTCTWKAAEDIDMHANSSSDETINMRINTIVMDLDEEVHLISKHEETVCSLGKKSLPTYDVNLPHMSSSLASYSENVYSTTALTTQIKYPKLIADKRIMLTEEEMRAQLKCPKIYCRSYKIEKRKRTLARTLLCSLSRNIKPASLHIFKQKRTLPTGRIRQQYLDLLREIFEYNVDDKLATEIYKNWQSNVVPRQRHKTPPAAPLHDYIDKECCNEFFADNNNNDKDKLIDTNAGEWNAYGIMMKLLDMWRYNPNDASADEIDVKGIFPVGTATRKEAAKGFSALLELSSKRFIEITHAPHTIEIQKVKLGAASEQLLRQAHIS